MYSFRFLEILIQLINKNVFFLQQPQAALCFPVYSPQLNHHWQKKNKKLKKHCSDKRCIHLWFRQALIFFSHLERWEKKAISFIKNIRLWVNSRCFTLKILSTDRHSVHTRTNQKIWENRKKVCFWRLTWCWQISGHRLGSVCSGEQDQCNCENWNLPQMFVTLMQQKQHGLSLHWYL